jgi:hypothetical protein
MKEKFGHLATWLPDANLKLGDVGLLQDGRFFQKKTLEDLRIPFKTRAGSEGGDWDHSSGSDVKVNFAAEAKAGVPGVPSGHAVVSFGSSGSFLFQAHDCRTETIENMAAVGDELVYAYRANAFDKSWIVIDRIVRAKSATVLISDSKTAEIELGADVPLTSLPSLADVSIGVKVRRWTGEVTRFVATASLTPLFGASYLHGILTPRVDPIRGEEKAGAADARAPVLGSVTVDDQLVGR